MLVEFREEIGTPSVEATADFLHYFAAFGRDVEEATKILNIMIDHGSKYKQLENLLGVGVCFVLPTNIGETKLVSVFDQWERD